MRQAPNLAAKRIVFGLGLLWHSSHWLTVLSAVQSLLIGTLPFLSLLILKNLIDAITTLAGGTGDPVARMDGITVWLVAAAAVALVDAVLGNSSRFLTEKLSLAVTEYLQTRVHRQSVRMDLEYFENPQYQDSLHRAQQQVTSRPASMLGDLVTLLQASVSIVSILWLVLSLAQWYLFLLFLLASLPALYVKARYGRRTYQLLRDNTSKARHIDYLHWLLTGVWQAKEIRAYGLGGHFIDRSAALRREFKSEKLNLARARAMAESASGVVEVIAFYGLLALLAVKTLDGSISLGQLVMFHQAMQRIQGFTRQGLGALGSLLESSLFIGDLETFLALRPRVKDPARPQPFPTRLQGGIVFRNVCFTYPSTGEEVLQDVDLTIRPGEHVAFVGENGAGKTTLIKLLCRFHDCTRGDIEIDGTSIRAFGLEDLRRQIAVLFQDHMRYYHRAIDNVCYGNIRRTHAPGEIAEALKHASALGLVEALSEQAETMVGHWFKGGHELSAGQWQRLALARMLYHKGQVFVLDEPTSAMDPFAEMEIVDLTRRYLQDRTTIIISHRMSTARGADRIVVLDRGRVLEVGSHTELLAREGKYRDMFMLQSREYRG